VLDHLDSHAALIAAAELGGARFSSAPYGVYRAHVALLLAEADPGCDADALAEMLLATLTADLFIHMRALREIPLERLKAGWRELVSRVLAQQPAGIAEAAGASA
jgi:hypothetical protein